MNNLMSIAVRGGDEATRQSVETVNSEQVDVAEEGETKHEEVESSAAHSDLMVAANKQYYIEKDKLERHCQVLVPTLASQNKVGT